MGGGAFKDLPACAFPRIPPAVYKALKARLTPRIEQAYTFVAVPFEAPEKLNYGDLDFVVAAATAVTVGQLNAPHDQVASLIGATHIIPMAGNRTSNFAVIINVGEWGVFGHTNEEEIARRDAAAQGQSELYYQVDINVCSDKAEWERIVFFHAYGDLGMILGLLARNHGLALGTKGLKLPSAPYPPFDLCESFDKIMDFMGLSMDIWKAGFQTKQEIFEWAGSSPFFDPHRFKSEGPGIRKVKPERKMYTQFVEWARQRAADQIEEDPLDSDSEERVKQALIYFNKKDEFDTLLHQRACEQYTRTTMKEVWNGKKVMAWTGFPPEYWKGVKMVMDRVRQTVQGDEGVLAIFELEGEAGLQRLVSQAKADLGLPENPAEQHVKSSA